MTADDGSYFGAEAATQAAVGGSFVRWDAIDEIEMVPGLFFQPVLGERVMVNFVRFEPHTEAPLHWHEEEQISFVLDGEFEFEVGGDKRTVRRGEAIVIPPNVPHGARTYDSPCLEVDVFHPPRQGVVDAMNRAQPDS